MVLSQRNPDFYILFGGAIGAEQNVIKFLLQYTYLSAASMVFI